VRWLAQTKEPEKLYQALGRGGLSDSDSCSGSGRFDSRGKGLPGKDLLLVSESKQADSMVDSETYGDRERRNSICGISLRRCELT